MDTNTCVPEDIQAGEDLPPPVPIPKTKSFRDLTGEKFGLLEAVYYCGRTRYRQSIWVLRCECGGSKVTSTAILQRSRNINCGGRAHKVTALPEYESWIKMKQRCFYPNHDGYENYGGRGITVCERWRDNFKQFLEDMGPKPGPEYTLDRIDSNQNYSPENCRWASPLEQSRNRRNSVYYTVGGVTLHRHEWAKKLGISADTIKDRIRRGWPVEKAVLTPVRT